MSVSALRDGARVALVAPASPFETERLEQVAGILRDRGFDLVYGGHLFCRHGYLAGTEADRAQDLIDAINDPSIAAIICVRGGYGSSRLLPWLPFSGLRGSPKIFLGYSDITFLHLAFLGRMDWITFHGPNLIDANSRPGKLDSVFRALQGENCFSWLLQPQQILRDGIVTGRVFGGNLTCIAHSIGTEYFPDLEGGLLLVEDCGEALYRLDRAMNHLKLSGLLARLSGLILGNFKDCGEPHAIHDMVLDHCRSFDFPIIVALPFGHDDPNDVIPFGIPFTLNTYERTFGATQSPFAA
ncbi:S66 peptidase family protein [Desulfoferrobacter suflitae]|uniref:S66 peptidase family protein n=1 Tax=Desulfoferrobacter suflitae TaxID=2865782 RepID=UPI0021640592|nr:LD-carboxypeptidase [Desulfoferrobacter suflitae]MCK8604009.1 LD-carboxypeptidase [Desulfoferrobacter suflitae]